MKITKLKYFTKLQIGLTGKYRAELKGPYFFPSKKME